MTSSRARIVVDRRCNRARSKVRMGQVGRSRSESLSEHTPFEMLYAEKAIVRAAKASGTA